MYDSLWLGGWIRFCILIPPNALRVGVSFMVTDVQVFCGYNAWFVQFQLLSLLHLVACD